MQELSKYLKKLRGEMSIRQVAEKTGISNAYLSQLERGKRDNPHPDVLKKLAMFYEIPVIEFLKKAGYLDEDIDEEENYEDKIDRLFKYVTNKPGYKYGHRIKRTLTSDVKKFVIEMYEKASGENLL
ncbi:MAG: helix-turn-helix transcriptional regulator [Deltaproteobacteria bacterium]|nr:helix-turn-helix transcriptional regulator [Deltaproteobacteria bacterium]